MSEDSRKYYKGVLAILIAALLWSTLGVMGKLFLKEGVDIIAGVSLRPLFAFLVLLLARPLFPSRKRPEKESKLKMAGFFALFGFVGVTVFYILYFIAVKITSISLAVILLYTAPIWVLIFSLLSRWEKFRPEKGAGIFLSLLGVFLIAQASAAEFSLWGFLAGLGSAVTYALFTYFGKLALKKYDLGTVLIWVFGFGALGFLPFWIVQPQALWQVLMSPTPLLLSFLMGLGPTAISYGGYLWALNYVPPSIAALTCTLEPVLGTLWGILFFKEELTVLKALGGLLVLIAILFAARQKGTAKQTPSLPIAGSS